MRMKAERDAQYFFGRVRMRQETDSAVLLETDRLVSKERGRGDYVDDNDSGVRGVICKIYRERLTLLTCECDQPVSHRTTPAEKLMTSGELRVNDQVTFGLQHNKPDLHQLQHLHTIT